MTQFLSPEAAARISLRRPYGLGQDPFTVGYVTKGGTYIIANNGRQNDDPGLVDLIAITVLGTPVALRPNVHPDFLDVVADIVAAP